MDQLMPRLNAAGTAWEAHPADAIALPPFIIDSGNVVNATAAAALAAVAGKTAYLTGFEVWAGGSTLGSLVDMTITGLLGGTITYPFSAPAGVLLGAAPLIINFPMAKPASAANVAITASLAALGTGNTKARVTAKGFYL